MGMYTKVRGWLEFDAKAEETPETIEARLETARQEYYSAYPNNRVCLPESTVVAPYTYNCTAFIFIGCELKNYDDDYNCWLPILCKHFPEASGRIDCQCDGQYFDVCGDSDTVLTIRIREGTILPDYTELAWC